MMRPWDLIGPAAVLAVMLVPRRLTAMTAAALLTVELFVLNGGFNALVDQSLYKPRLPIVEELRRIAPDEPFRVAGLEWMFLPNASAQYGLEDVRGSDPMAYAAYTELLRPVTVDDRSIDFDRLIDAQSPLLDDLNVRYLMTDPGVEPGGRWRNVYRGPDGSLFENPSARGRFSVAEGEGDVRVRSEGPGRYAIAVQARTPVRIVSSHVDARGWRVRGAERVRGTFLGVRVPAGSHDVRVTYSPLSFWLAMPVSLLAALLLTFRKSLE